MFRTLGMMFTAKDLASAQINKVDRSLKGLAADSEAVAATYDRNMARIRKGAMMLGVAIVGFLAMGKVTKTFGQFQYTMASAGVIMGATASQMRSLERAAIDAGIATQFSPREAAEGLQSLGAAGMNATQAMTALNPVLDLAAASMGQLGVAGAAEVTVGVLNAFSMSAERARDVADKLTRITQLTNFQFRDFSVAISQSASQAAAADQSFESMLATLGMLRNMNVHASVAATSYREAVRRLSADKRAHQALSKLGVDVLDKETGKIRDLGFIMAQIAPRLEALNSKEKGLMLTRIFGVRGMKVYSAFVGQYNKLVREGVVATGDFAGAHTRLVNELNNASGAAAKNRDALLKTAEGQRLLLKGSWETTQIMLGRLALPVVLPALKAFTDALNVFVQLLDMIPGPVRELIGTFGGAFLAFRALRGGVMLVRGAFGVLQLGRVAAGITQVGDAATGSAAKIGFMSRQMERMGPVGRGGIQILQSWASAATFLIPVAMGVIAYFQKQHAEEVRRQKEIREQNRRTQQSYLQAWDMAKALRKETAKAMAEQLEMNAKTEKGARKVLDQFREKYANLTKEVESAGQVYFKMFTMFGQHHPEVRKARAEYVRLTGKLWGVSRALIAAEARAAEFEIKRAKGVDRQMLARKIIAERMLSEQSQRKRIAKLQEDENTRLKRYSGDALKWHKRRSDARIAREKLATKFFGRETARIAVRFGLAKEELVKARDRRKRLRAMVEEEMVRPTMAAARRIPPSWILAARKGMVPADVRSAADIKRFRAALAARTRLTGEEFLAVQPRITLAAQRVEAGMPAAIPAAAQITAELPRIAPAPTPELPTAPGGPAMASVIQSALAAAATQVDQIVSRRPAIININMDGERIWHVLTKYDDRAERDQDGTQEPAGEQGVQGAG